MRIAHHSRALIIILINPLPKHNVSFSRRFISSNPYSPTKVSPKSMASDEAPIPDAAVDQQTDDEKYGFRRPEMYQDKLADSVGAHGRHLFLCYKTPETWPPRLEASDADPLPKRFASVLKSRKDDITVKTNLTIFEAREGSTFVEGDVLVFPEMIGYRNLKESDVDSFVQDVVVRGVLWGSGEPQAVDGTFVFVCSHNSRDRRCGVCGPALIERFIKEIGSRGLSHEVNVMACSHIGGHKYAGNLIIFTPRPYGKTMGNWYGYVTPDDVPELIDQQIVKEEIVQRLWRGRLGLITEEVEKANKEKLPNVGKESGSSNDIKQQESAISLEEVNKESFTSCCQGSNGGFTCCRDESLEANGQIEEKNLEARGGDGGGSICKMKSWVGSLEQKDVLTVAAVVGAVSMVAVAYGYYRRSH